jgi:hypothetical protein
VALLVAQQEAPLEEILVAQPGVPQAEQSEVLLALLLGRQLEYRQEFQSVLQSVLLLDRLSELLLALPLVKVFQ